MGNERLFVGTRAHAPAERLVGGTDRGQISLPLVFPSLHAVFCSVWHGLVGGLPDCISNSPGRKRGTDGPDGPDDDGACSGKTFGARPRIRGCTRSARTDPWSSHCRGHSTARLLALAFLHQSTGRRTRNRIGCSLPAQRP